MKNKPILGVIIGDAAGVGPELVAKLVASRFLEQYCRPIILGDVRVLNKGAAACGLELDLDVVTEIDQVKWTDGVTPLLNLPVAGLDQVAWGELSVASGQSSLEALTLAVELFEAGRIDGFVFAPLNKMALKEAGCKFESEHHFLADLLKHTEPFGEINVVGNVWTTRTTSHIPIAEVSQNLTEERILRAIRLADTTLKNSGIAVPKLGIAALNPHAGEGGRCGREEVDVIAPTVAKAQAMGIAAEGPFPADTLFIKAFNGDFDGVVTMFHDQGQIALKLKGFDEGITIAGGFKIPIVTCGHGTAYDIAGKGIVRTGAFENAVKMAAQMASHLKREASE